MADPHKNRKVSRSGLSVIRSGKTYRITQFSTTVSCGMSLESARRFVKDYEYIRVMYEIFLYRLKPSIPVPISIE